ncbi:hypothetical protein B5M09_011351, partial [Aphanomyces astaci]
MAPPAFSRSSDEEELERQKAKKKKQSEKAPLVKKVSLEDRMADILKRHGSSMAESFAKPVEVVTPSDVPSLKADNEDESKNDAASEHAQTQNELERPSPPDHHQPTQSNTANEIAAKFHSLQTTLNQSNASVHTTDTHASIDKYHLRTPYSTKENQIKLQLQAAQREILALRHQLATSDQDVHTLSQARSHVVTSTSGGVHMTSQAWDALRKDMDVRRRFIDDQDELVKQLQHSNEQLKEQLHHLMSTNKAKSRRPSSSTTDKRRIQTLEAQLKDMHVAMQKRHPDSLVNLILASKPDDVVAQLERQIQQLHDQRLEIEAQHEVKLTRFRQQHERVVQQLRQQLEKQHMERELALQRQLDDSENARRQLIHAFNLGNTTHPQGSNTTHPQGSNTTHPQDISAQVREKEAKDDQAHVAKAAMDALKDAHNAQMQQAKDIWHEELLH